MTTLRIGTRGSLLATTQTQMVIDQIQGVYPSLTIERVLIETDGDRNVASLLAIGGQGVFTKALEVALLEGRIDVAVHSLKDLPSILPDGLTLAATPTRANAHDVLITRNGAGLNDLPQGAVIGTGSLRRRAQLLAVRPGLVMKDIRGNVDTRLRKLNEGDYDAIVLAAAGLARLGRLNEVHAQELPYEWVLPAPAQGILGLECRADDLTSLDLVAGIDDGDAHAAATAERAILRRFGAGCRLPLSAFAEVREGDLYVMARVNDVTGQRRFEATAKGDPRNAEALGRDVAEALVAQGALGLLASLPPEVLE